MSRNSFGNGSFDSIAYDTWRTGYPPEWDEPDPEPICVAMVFAIDDKHGSRYFRVRGQWNPAYEQWDEAEMYEIDEDGEDIGEPIADALAWDAATRAMATGKYEDCEGI